MINKVLVNLGCGSVFHRDWINLDSIPATDIVRRWDIRKPLPFETGQIDVCYASHVLEHLPRSNASDLLRECHRVLIPGGVIRLAVPDLESIASAYLKSVRDVADGAVPVWQHDWMTIELIDQMVRREGGGEMHRALVEADDDRRKFAVGRIGLEAESVFASVESRVPGRLSLARIAHYARRAREEFAGILTSLVLGAEGRAALREGLFRRSGQVHQWMYDRISLKRLLEEAGFIGVNVCQVDESRIDQFNSFNLDTLNGRVRKPDSLFMEAVRP
jgi:predicted SAM-dependent methyltransferase